MCIHICMWGVPLCKLTLPHQVNSKLALKSTASWEHTLDLIAYKGKVWWVGTFNLTLWAPVVRFKPLTGPSLYTFGETFNVCVGVPFHLPFVKPCVMCRNWTQIALGPSQ